MSVTIGGIGIVRNAMSVHMGSVYHAKVAEAFLSYTTRLVDDDEEGMYHVPRLSYFFSLSLHSLDGAGWSVMPTFLYILIIFVVQNTLA